MKIEVTSNDILRGDHILDLFEEGDFIVDFIEIEHDEYPQSIYYYGTWKKYDPDTEEVKETEAVIFADIDSEEALPIEKVTSQHLLNVGWEWWTILV